MTYEIDILGYECLLCFFNGNLEKVCEHTLLFDYSNDADFAVFDIGEKRTDDSLVSLAASAFFGSFRGYPEMMLDLSFENRRLGVQILGEKGGRVSLNIPKCKSIFTKMHTFADLSELPVTTVLAPSATIRTAEVYDAESFSVERLALMRSLPEMPVCDAAFALSWDNSIVRACSSPSPKPSSYFALFAYLNSIGALGAETNGCKIIFDNSRALVPFSVSRLS